jgi:hypothetical protein
MEGKELIRVGSFTFEEAKTYFKEIAENWEKRP